MGETRWYVDTVLNTQFSQDMNVPTAKLLFQHPFVFALDPGYLCNHHPLG